MADVVASIGMHGSWMTVFAFYFCAVNPILEEAFWRSLFGTNNRRLVLADVAYGCFHFLALRPFMYASYATVAALALVATGYT